MFGKLELNIDGDDPKPDGPDEEKMDEEVVAPKPGVAADPKTEVTPDEVVEPNGDVLDEGPKAGFCANGLGVVEDEKGLAAVVVENGD